MTHLLKKAAFGSLLAVGATLFSPKTAAEAQVCLSYYFYSSGHICTVPAIDDCWVCKS